MTATRLADFPLALAAGVIAAHGFPPDGLPVLTLLGLGLLFIRLPGASPRRGACLAWLFAAAWQFSSLTWVSEAFLVTMPGMGGLALAPILGLAAGLALFLTAAVYLWRRFWPGSDRPSAANFLGLAVAVSLAEWAMGHALTGFPWAITALAFAETELAYNVRALGAYGLGLTVLAATAAALGSVYGFAVRRRFARRDIIVIALAGAVLGLPWDDEFSPRAPASDPAAWPVIRMVQGNTPQREKWRPGNRTAIFARHIGLSRAPAERPLAAIVWPETATPFPVTQSKTALAALANAAPEGGYVILGAPLRDRLADGRIKSTNSLVAIDRNGAVAARYDKSHLVPGGEYVPFEDYLPLGKLVEGRGSFTPGPGIRTIDLPGLPPFSPLICYEVIFPGAVVESGGVRPAFLLNITNDAWYGVTAGPYQHLAIARLRALEEGLPLIRVANTGISAAYDADGKELGRIPLNQTAFLDIPLPPPAPPTIYAQYGDALYFALALLLAGLGLTARR